MSSHLTPQQVYNGVFYSKAVNKFITSVGFIEIYKVLAKGTQEVLVKNLKYSPNIPSFAEIVDPLRYFYLLEKSIEYKANDWTTNLEKLFQFFRTIIAYYGDRMKMVAADYKTFKETLGNLCKGRDQEIVLVAPHRIYQLPQAPPAQVQPQPYQKDSNLPQGATHKAYSAYVSESKKFDPKECYSINETGKRGVCLILNIYRGHAYADVTDARNKFEELGYKVIYLDNCTGNDLLESLDSISKDIEELNSDSFIFILSSHGDAKSIQLSDDTRIQRDHIIARFLPSYCPFLKGKPKLFFFQSCRGNDSYSPSHDYMDILPSSKYVDPIDNPDSVANHLPKDVLRYFASTEGHVAYRSISGLGSIFLQALFDTLRDEDLCRQSINSLQPHLTRMVTENKEFPESQLPDYNTTLLKNFYFKHPDK